MTFKLVATSLLLAAALPLAAHADLPGQHPGYLHALSDLRDARWNLEHRPGDGAVSSQEDVAIEEIDQALGDVKNAAREDDNPEARGLKRRAMDHVDRAMEAAKHAIHDVEQGR